ncbi:hypothetical protein Tco_0465295 [Tanacetum coccineum]
MKLIGETVKCEIETMVTCVYEIDKLAELIGENALKQEIGLRSCIKLTSFACLSCCSGYDAKREGDLLIANHDKLKIHRKIILPIDLELGDSDVLALKIGGHYLQLVGLELLRITIVRFVYHPGKSKVVADAFSMKS